MAKQPRLTRRQLLIIREHNDILIEGAKADLLRCESIPLKGRPPFITGQIAYWRHAIRALQWSNAIAEQRLQVEQHGR